MIISTQGNAAAGFLTTMSIAQGETVATAITVKDLDLTSYTLKMRIAFATPLDLTSTNGGIVLTNPTGGQFQLSIPDTTTAALIPGTYQYDLWMISPSGSATPILKGSFIVQRQITPIP